MPDTIPQLMQEIATIEQALQELADQLREKMGAEKPEQGVFFAAEIHAMRQQKLVLQTRKELRAVRIRRIKYMGELEDLDSGNKE